MPDNIQKILEEIDNYEQSVNALLAMLHLYKFDNSTKRIDPTIKGWFGKTMMPGEITPDLVIQLSNMKGIIAELKKSFPKNDKDGKDLWAEEFEQLKSYDDDLTGWETTTQKIDEQDLVLLTSQKLCVPVCDYIQANNITFNRFSKNFSVWQFNQYPGIKQAIFLQKRHGSISDNKDITDNKLRQGIALSMEYLTESGLSKVKFMDNKPHVVHLMSILWDFVFSSMPTEEDWRNARESRGGKIVEIPIKVDDIKKILNDNFTLNGGENGVIRNEWLKEALDNFVTLKLAIKSRGEYDYIIKFRKKIRDEEEDEKHKVFAELLFHDSRQTSLNDLHDVEDERGL